MTEKPNNIVFFPSSVNFGLAGTNRQQNIIYYLKKEGITSIANIALEPGTNITDSHSGDLFIKEYKEIYYGPSLLSFIKHLFIAPLYLLKFKKAGYRNVVFFYGEVDLKNFLFVLWARLINYKVVIDIVEDLDAHVKFRSFKNKLKYRSAVFFRKRLDLFADGFIAVSSHLLGKFTTKFPGLPLFFLPVTINSDLLQVSKINRTDQPLTLLYSGSFNEKDGLPTLLQGLKLVKEDGIPFCLMLSGKGTDQEMDVFWDAVSNCGLETNVNYVGLVSREEYQRLLAHTADVLCMTRINSAYANAGFPFKLGEFLATGKPVIASKVGDVQKYLSDKDAFLIEPENAEQIRAAVVSIVTDRPTAAAVGINGKKVALEYFDHAQYSANLKEFITETIWL